MRIGIKPLLIITVILTILGIFLRCKLYLFGRPLWNDESALIIALQHAGNNLFFLEYNQAAPPLFLIITKFMIKIFNENPYSLRLFPLISSCLSILCFYFLSDKILTKRSSKLFAMFLFCFSFRLIYFAQEFKQYSTDVLVFIIILLSYFNLDIAKLKTKKLITIGIIYSLCFWLSYPSLIAIATIFLTMCIKNYKKYKYLLILYAPTIVSFVLLFILQNHLNNNDYLHIYWKDFFIATDFSNFSQLIFNFISYYFDNLILLFILFILSFGYSLLKIKNEQNMILVYPILFACILSYLSLYPLGSRVSLYLLPVIILLISKFFEYLLSINKTVTFIFISVLSICVIFPYTYINIQKTSSENFEYEDIITPLKYAKVHSQPTDIIYISNGSEIAYQYYKNKFNFKNIVIEKERITNSKDYRLHLEKLPNGKYYYIFSHFPNKRARLTDVCNWAKNKKDFDIMYDKSLNATIVFTK